jgi:hypothetical protein
MKRPEQSGPRRVNDTAKSNRNCLRRLARQRRHYSGKAGHWDEGFSPGEKPLAQRELAAQ